ncbi:ABC transporter permease [Corynebacteriaceae bacterium 6-324]
MSDKDTNQVFDKEVTDLLSTIKVKLAESGKDSPTVVVDNSRIRPKSARLPIHRYVAQIWHLRHFIVLHARYKAVADNDEMFLGKLWTVLEPIFRIAMYGIMFGLILNTSRGIENFIGFLTIGITYFGFISRGPNSGAGLVQRTQNLIGTFNFPRATVVVGESVRGFFMALIPALLATIGALLFQLDKPLSWTILWAIPLLVLIQIFAAGLMFISARITAFLPDARRMMQFIMRAWFYISGVFFSVERYANVPEIQAVMVANPAYQFLNALRDSIMYATTPDLQTWLYLGAWSFGTLLIGFIYFWQAESRYVHIR